MGWFTNPQHAFCHGIANHAWHWPPEVSHEGRRLKLALDCTNCTARRTDKVNSATGVVESRSYKYPEGYLLDLRGEKRPAKAVLRKDGLALLLDSATSPRLRVVNGKRRRRTRAA